MLHETILLDINYTKAGLSHVGKPAELITYIQAHDKSYQGDKVRPLMLICPGGGYKHLSTRESEPIAIKMLELGYNACILNYSLTPNRYPSQLLEAAKALSIIKEHAKEWHVNTENIVICGFSAGSHVAGSLGTMWKEPVITDVLGGSSTDYRPSKMLLCYPVITAGEFAHRGSFDCLLGEGNTEKYDEVSLENRVNEDTVPTFIWHTFADGAVPVENSLLMTLALRKHHIPCEVHIFERGGHGLALATDETNTLDGKTIEAECAVWPKLFANWMNK